MYNTKGGIIMSDNGGLLTVEALTFLKGCDYNNRDHKERTGLIKLARELYPDPLANDPNHYCAYNSNNEGCKGIEDNRCKNYRCMNCYWL